MAVVAAFALAIALAIATNRSMDRWIVARASRLNVCVCWFPFSCSTGSFSIALPLYSWPYYWLVSGDGSEQAIEGVMHHK